MVHDEVWAAAGLGKGRLCVGCIETRLGRPLTRADFNPKVAVNATWHFLDGTIRPERTERLRQRLETEP